MVGRRRSTVKKETETPPASPAKRKSRSAAAASSASSNNNTKTADEEVVAATTPRKTKKQILAEARLRAKKAMATDTAKATASVQKKRKADSSNNDSNNSNDNVSEVEDVQTAPTPAKRRRRNPEPESPPKVKSPEKPKTPSTLSKKAKLEMARQKARAWDAEEKRRKEELKSPPPPPPAAVSSTEAAAPVDMTAFLPTCKPASVVSKESAVKQAMMGYSGKYPTRASAVTSSGMATTPVQDEDDDDDDVIPPPPTDQLEMQISKQVMANVQAAMMNQPTPFNEPPPESEFPQVKSNSLLEDDEDEEGVEDDDQPIEVDGIIDPPYSVGSHADPSMTPKDHQERMYRRFGAIVAVLVFVFAWWPADDLDLTGFIMDSSPPCFQDTNPRIVDGVTVNPCLGQPNIPCPMHGYCRDGALITCPSQFYQKDEVHKDRCEWTSATKEAVEQLESLLHRVSVGSICRGGGGILDDDLPSFEYQQLLSHPNSNDLMRLDVDILEQSFEVEADEQGRLLVGLVDGTLLSLPLECRLRRGFQVLLQAVGGGMEAFARRCFHFSWATMRAYPLASILSLLAILTVQYMRFVQHKRSQLILDVAKMRDLVFSKLMDEPNTNHAALHIRDEIVTDVFAVQDTRTRAYWNDEVWSRVIPQIQQDHRIRKTQKVQAPQGLRRDYWQWVASVRKPKQGTAAAVTVQG
eukprot:Nitzschia sp. Nitz4//scaffold116_size91068//82447//84525//NITZ4_004970-RA/size91068-processed-gene-0.36-mRNA-1//1//CDS//3329533614//3293//frame0